MANSKTKTAKKLKALSLIYVTTPSLKVARHISHQLLKERLVSCSNILPLMRSEYRWKGRIESAKECVLILKSAHSLARTVTSRIQELHPYETPCILEIKVESAAKAYAAWILDSVDFG
jgi:periplasmic divalent cation tolerance protein